MALKDILREQLIRHEGLKLVPYRDTVGKWTIAVGRNLEDVGIRKDEALFMLDNDINTLLSVIPKIYSWFANLSENRQSVVVNMVFNMGLHGFSEFQRMIAAISRGDFKDASLEMLNSEWAKEVGQRAVELAKLMENG